jgi:hypothetical protein
MMCCTSATLVLQSVGCGATEPRESAFVQYPSTATTLNDPTHIVAAAMGRCPVNAHQRRAIFSKYDFARRVWYPACRATGRGIARRRARQSPPRPTQQRSRPSQRMSSASYHPPLAVPPGRHLMGVAFACSPLSSRALSRNYHYSFN